MSKNDISPNAALRADAGPYAQAIARLWPRPHAPYFAADAGRRRVIQLVAQARMGDAPGIRDALENWSLKRIAAAYMPNAPAGLIEVLKKVVGPAWSFTDYGRLIEILKCGAPGAKTLQHAPVVDRLMVANLAGLPAALRRPRILVNIPLPQAASLVGRAAHRACAVDDFAALSRLADRLERARSTHGLFQMLIDEIGLEQLAPPPIPGTDWLKHLASAREIESAALRFENCLAGRIPWLVMGKGAYYEVVRGGEPAIVEIVRDVAGLWVVGEVRGHANSAVSPELMAQIRVYLAQHGAQVHGLRPDALALALAAAAGW